MQEIWKDIKWYEWLYKISNMWKVMSMTTWKILKDRITLWYNQVTLTKCWKPKQYKVHRLVLINFLWEPDEWLMCNHKNWIRNDNRLENLEWVTRWYNMWHWIHILWHKPWIPPMWKYSNCSKHVIQKNKDDSLVKEWYCMSDIERELWYDQWNISTACKKWCIRYWYKRELA